MVGSRRVLFGSLGKRIMSSSLILALAVAADSPGDDKPKSTAEGDQRVALTDLSTAARPGLTADLAAKAVGGPNPSIAEGSSARAIRTILDCRRKFDGVKDYTCIFYKRERIDGKLSDMNVMSMKMRNEPHSIYFRFHQPNKGREAIYVDGKNGGFVLAHDVGFTKLLAGTMKLDPNGARAMEGCRHPITKAGIGKLIETVHDRWTAELNDQESIVLFDPKIRLGSAPCLLIEAIHPERKPHFLFHKVRLFVDEKLGLPVRFEAYDWPSKPGEAPELLEEYAYDQVKLNVGLGESDFDAGNQLYSFGRF